MQMGSEALKTRFLPTAPNGAPEGLGWQWKPEDEILNFLCSKQFQSDPIAQIKHTSQLHFLAQVFGSPPSLWSALPLERPPCGPSQASPRTSPR